MAWQWLDPATEPAAVEGAWRRLEAAYSPVWFLRWPWVENWLATLPAREMPVLALAGSATAPAAGLFVARRRQWRHGLLPVRGCHLNTTGDPAIDDLWIEYNAVLGPPDLDWAELLGALPESWDEFHLPALDVQRFPGCAVNTPPRGMTLRIGRRIPSPQVDLAAVRGRLEAGGDYPDLLGRNTRHQIRRSLRLAEATWGPVRLEVATDRPTALAVLERLETAHIRSWNERGEPGAFAGDYFRRFHRRLVAEHFESGIQLLTLFAGEYPLAYLYNLVADGRVLFYQSGIPRPEDNRIKPGLMAHAAAVRHNAEQGHAVYDFLGGETRYKQSLATGAGELVWATLQRPRLRLRLEGAARAIRHRLRHGVSTGQG